MGQNNSEFVIAALGASAGGLEAFEKFFNYMPSDAGIAFIVVQHLAPDHATALPELLAKYTHMPVEQARDRRQVAPNRVYIIPPNATLTIQNSILQVTAPTEARGHRTPIDSLFSSLAEDCGENAVCIMLSGTGTDGTLGLRAIKEFGGMAMAQTLESAKYDSILRSAIATGLVDHVLPVEEMPAKLMEYAGHLNSTNGNSDKIRAQIGTHLGKIHGLLRRRVGHDFSAYKETAIARRVGRRMKALQIETIDQYVQALEDQPEEADRLFKDLLIGVTHFFRDTEAFEVLAREVIPKLFEGKTADDQVRACVVGCATGEEAYSIAILLSEHAATIDNSPTIKVFATDIDERGLEVARKGRYPASIVERLSPERLERFFNHQENAYQVKRELRELCIFTVHSFIKDPPFARQDLISCRNVMIYLGSDLQQKIIPLFHYALRSGGYLFLGPSESVSSRKELFQTLDKKHRIFKRKEMVPRPVVELPSPRDVSRPSLPGGLQAEAEPNISKQLERIILQRYRPACVTVKENGDAVFFSGGMGRYLEPALGTPSVNVIIMAREGLRIPLRTALYKAVTTRERVVQQVPVQINGSVTQIDLTVEPIAEFAAANLFMIVFEDVAPAASVPRQPFDAQAEETIRHLEGELRAAHDQAQAMFEELESSNEELKSANEEYQSTNEELETSKEEAQSTNEELETVNNELTRRVTELDHSNSDLQNLNNSTQIASIFLDSELHIRNFTPAAGSVFHLIAGDIGRPITDLAAQFAGVDLIVDICRGGGHYLVRIMPYRTVYNVIDGVVITFTDVTQLKQTEQVAADAKEYAESIVETVRQPLLVLDSDLRVKSANAAFFKMFQVTEDATLNQFFYELGDGQWDIPNLRALLGEILTEKKRVEDFLVEHQFPNIGPATMLLNASQVSRRNGAPPLILLAIEDITARNRAEDALRQANRDLQYFAYAASHDLQEPIRMVTSYAQLLAKEFKGQLGAKGDQFIEFALEGALRMEALLNGLRDYWAINEEKVEPSVVAEGNYALQEALKMLDARVQESGAIITHDPLPTVRAEDLPLILLFQNLIGNALKYVREGARPRIHVSVQRDAGQWHFSVQDNGLGIDAKHLKMIFEPFKRLHGQKVSGSGLGLAICQRIVERYKGRIWAESNGQGSTFHFMIPP
jgi:two-component system, chemotaxis family, CheB/CheR fusion protein